MNKVCKISLISLISVCSFNTDTFARINIKSSNSRSYADAYNQVANIRYQQEYANGTNVTTASDTGDLPVAVDDKKLAAEILNNSSTSVTMSDLEKCSMIYPGGLFRWGIPESGVRQNQTPQCIAVVELRDANTKAILATTTVAAGDTIKCNVDSFPESGYSYDLKYGKIEVPADAAPTIEEVEAVMNQEQKQNAGFKIAAATIIAGIAGNMLAPKEAGDDKLFGTSSKQIQDTAIGAVAGAGIMAASTYSGKVAGDTIKSTAVNAASGMIVGNMLAGANGSDGVLATTTCRTKDGEKDCIIGNISISDENSTFSSWKENQKILNNTIAKTECDGTPGDMALIKSDGSSILICKNEDGNPICCYNAKNNLVNITVKTNSSSLSFKKLTSSEIENKVIKYRLAEGDEQRYNKYVEITNNQGSTGTPIYYEITDASSSSGKKHAFAVFDNLKTKAFGYKVSDWEDLESKYSPKYYYRNNDYSVDEEVKVDRKNVIFEPSTRDASDGSLVDISNEARAKGTLVGTAAGGAIGGFAGYQGAKAEISERWTTAVRAYNDSLTNFACTTNGKFLASYNSYVDIPELKKDE